MIETPAIDVECARLEIERERLRLEQTRLRIENKFWNKNTGTVITAMISLVAVVVSLSQVWVAKITKDRELQMTAIQKQSELTLLQIDTAMATSRMPREKAMTIVEMAN